MHHEYALLTPEKVVIAYRPASVASRIMAHLLDLVIAVVAILVIVVTISRFGIVIDEGLVNLMISLIAAFGLYVYFTLFEGLWNGQTLGKKAFKLRVRQEDGTPITFGAALARNLVRFADFLPMAYLLGLGAMAVNQRSQRLGDLFARTVVLHEPDPVPHFAPAPHRFGVHPLEDQVGELRGMTMEEYLAVKRLCDRFPELTIRLQEQTLQEVWAPFAAKHKIATLPGIHPVYLMEAAVMRFGREHNLV